MTDYIPQLISYVPYFVILGIIFIIIKYGTKYAIEKSKMKKTEEKNRNKPKGIMETIIDGIEQAPKAKQLLDQEIKNLMDKGATQEQMKSLKSKQQFVNFMANDYVQMLAVPGIQFAKDNLKGLLK